jgi:hypothetical protein
MVVSSLNPAFGDGTADEEGAGDGGIGREGGISFLPSFRVASTGGILSPERKVLVDAVWLAALVSTSSGVVSLGCSRDELAQLATSIPHDERISLSSSARRVEGATTEGATAGIGIVALLRENMWAMGRGMAGTGGMTSLSTVPSEEAPSAFFLLEIRKNDRRDLARDGLTGDDGVERDEV